MKMTPINVKNTKRCAIRKHWYDPAGTAIEPLPGRRNMWEYDPNAKKMCMKKRYERPSGASCTQFECKIQE